MGPKAPPNFCRPIANLYEIKKELIGNYLEKFKLNEKTLDPKVQ
jgi:hypothetical protein